MKWLVMVGMVAACAPAPPEKLRDPRPKFRHEVREARRSPPKQRPLLDYAAPELHLDLAIAEPDPSHEIRWPLSLSDHPELAPHFDVAKVLAEPGLDWIELCKMGAHRRTVPKLRDQLLYLRAWCSVGAHDHPGAIETFVKLRSTVVPGLAAAIRVDLTNVLVSHDPDSARELVGTFQLATEADVLDRLAATYVEVGKLSGAREINELALANDSGKSPSKTCQRLTRRILLDPEAYRTSGTAFSTKAPVPGFADDPTPLLFGAKLNTDPQCHELDAKLSCWLVKSNCSAWYNLRGMPKEDAFLLDANMAWPRGYYRASPDAWWAVVTPALDARPKREAYAFAILALEAALQLTDCDSNYAMGRALDTLVILANDANLPSEVMTRVKWLDEKSRELCFKP